MRAGFGLIACAALFVSQARAAEPARWTSADLRALLGVIAASANEGLRPADYDPAALDRAAREQAADLDARADAVALRLARDMFEGRTPVAARADWHLARAKVDYRAWLDEVLARHSIAGSYARLLPTGPAYTALKMAFADCRVPKQGCDAIAMTMERWRWLPRDLGRRYLWVNVPAYRLDLIDDGQIISSHKVIVGKAGTRTPLFKASVKGITINPWWNVPCSIVDESIGKLVREHPEEAARKGYVASTDAKGQLTVRQRPGPDNALGRIKLEMPNPYNVYIHDTPARSLFDKDARAFSHGCIRTQEPEQLARALLGRARDREVETLLLTGVSRTLPLPAPLPVYVVYMTAEPDQNGTIATYKDVYRRDAGPAGSAAKAPSP